MQELLSRLLEPVDIYRPRVAVGWEDVSQGWELVTTIPMYIESVTGTEAIMNQQNFQGITEVGISPIEYLGVVKEGYGIVSADGVQRINKGIPEKWGFIQPHTLCSLKREQFPIQVL